MGTQDVCVDKGIRAVNGAVDVGFGCKVDYSIYLLLLQQVQYEVVIPDIAMLKTKPRMIFLPGKVGPVPRIGEGIKHCYPVIRMVFDPVVDKIGTYKTRTPCD
jgi:hypothetical protein